MYLFNATQFQVFKASIQMLFQVVLVDFHYTWPSAESYSSSFFLSTGKKLHWVERSSVGLWLSWLSTGCHAGGREFNSGRTNAQGLKVTEKKVLPLQLH